MNRIYDNDDTLDTEFLIPHLLSNQSNQLLVVPGNQIHQYYVDQTDHKIHTESKGNFVPVSNAFEGASQSIRGGSIFLWEVSSEKFFCYSNY